MFSFQIFCAKNFSANRASNKNISNFIQQLRNLAYYPKREPIICFEKCMFMLIKYLVVTKAK